VDSNVGLTVLSWRLLH